MRQAVAALPHAISRKQLLCFARPLADVSLRKSMRLDDASERVGNIPDI